MMPGWTLPLLLLCALAGPLCSDTHASTIVVPTNESTTTPEVTSMTAVTEEPTDRSTTFSPNATEPFVTSNLTEAPEITSTVVGDTEENTSVDYTTVTATDTTFTDSSTVVATVMGDGGYTTEMPHLNSSLIIEDDEGGLSTGQVVGIVIGSLVAVVVVIVVVVMGMRRMGQYSP
ncbi:uncharacterized protein si:ch211-156j16.1 [Brienomyrus brachyistius]|uniref:uncharacterized protein si:ch211-156j16.1 n=1 Tax=Brienomyrus brachyistius TaxID=42636 RepID=UPI0020B3741C|nr:uncharacterized protein si:ch211-156j16.1 [Brienomyrus brachyistius]